jgi:hemolysin activation/secretion protein
MAKPDDDAHIKIAGFALSENAPEALRLALPVLTQRFTGKDRSFEDLAGAAAEITRWLQRELGWYLGYAYVPVQVPQVTADGNIVQLALLEGRLDRVVLNWDEGIAVKKEVVEAHLAHLVPGQILLVREIERTVFLINDLRGLTAQFEVRAGKTTGTAELVVTAKPEDRWSIKLESDLNGSRYMGQSRTSALGQWNSPLGFGDVLTSTLMSSSTGGLRFGLLGYTAPMGSNGTKLSTALSAVTYALDKQQFPLELHGSAMTFNVSALYPWVRSRNLNVFSIASLESKHYEDSNIVNSTRKRVETFTLGSTGDFRDSVLGGGVNTYDASLISGQVRYPQGRPSGLLDAAHFSKVTGSATRLQDIVSGRLLGYVALRGQWSDKNLDTTEQFRVGGPDGVRGFAPGEGTGDAGAIATLELRWLLPQDWFGRVAREMVASAFYDAGHIRYRNQPAAGSRAATNDTFTSAGIGLAWVRANQWSLRFTLAQPQRGTPLSDARVRDPRLYALANFYFR